MLTVKYQSINSLRPYLIMYTGLHFFSKHLPVSLLLTTLFFFTGAYGQTGVNSYGRIVVEITKQHRPKKISAKVEITTAFPGGDSTWIRTLETNLNRTLTYRNGAKKGKYLVTVVFIITKDGTLSEIRNLTDPGFGMGAEVIRAIKKGSKWTPAPQGGIKVRVIDTNRLIPYPIP